MLARVRHLYVVGPCVQKNQAQATALARASHFAAAQKKLKKQHRKTLLLHYSHRLSRSRPD
jgi:hypothetical protein